MDVKQVFKDTTSLVGHCVWDSLPLDVLASVAVYLRPKYLADARLVCKSWCRGISLGIKHLQPKLQSPLGGRSGILAGLYVYALRWHEIPQLLVSPCDQLWQSLASRSVWYRHGSVLQWLSYGGVYVLQRAFPSCKKLNLHLATITVDCAKYLAESRRLACVQIRSESFCSSSGNSPLIDLYTFARKLQVCQSVECPSTRLVTPCMMMGSM